VLFRSLRWAILFILFKLTQRIQRQSFDFFEICEWQFQCCAENSMATAANWNVPTARYRAVGGLSEKLNIAVKSADSASAEDHWKPWNFRVADGCVELFANSGTFSEALDPDGRETIFRCGAALQSLKLSLKRQGCLCRTELFPALDEPALVARIHVGVGGVSDDQERMLFDAMTRAGEHFLPAGNSPVSDAALSLISSAVAGDRAWLELAQSESSRGRLLEIARASERSRAQRSEIRCEVQPSSSGGESESNRLKGKTFINRFIRQRKPALDVKLRITVPTVDIEDGVIDVPDLGAFGVVKTKTDDKRGWVAAGQTVTLLVQTAQALGVSCTFFNRTLRKATVREELRTGIGHKGFAQAITQLRATGHPIPAAMAYADTAPRNSL
jgi:hypothetical protein